MSDTRDTRLVTIHQVSWGAVFAGAVAALVATLILNMIGLGIGVATLDLGTSDNPTAASLSIGAGLWWLVSGVLASAAGGFLAGRLSGKPSASTAGYHGLVSWAVSTMVVIYLLTSTVGGIVGGALGTVTGALGGAGQAAGGAIQTAAQAAAPSLARVTDPFAGIETQVRGATGGQDPAALRDLAVSAIRAALSGDPGQQAEAREKAAQALARAQGIPVEEARRQIAGYAAEYTKAVEEAKARATAVAKATAATVSRGALIGSLALILGALAAFFAGQMGAVRRDIPVGA